MRLIETLRMVAEASIVSAMPNRYEQTFVYSPPTIEDEDQPTTQLASLRVDVRRDARLLFVLAKTTFPTTGTIQEEPFTIPGFRYDATDVLTLQWVGVVPDGCSLEGVLYDADTDLALTAQGATVVTHPKVRYRNFECTRDQTKFYAIFTLTGDGTQTPILQRWRVFKDPGNVVVSYTEKQADVFDVNLVGPSDDATIGVGLVSVHDVTDDLRATLGARTFQKAILETQYDKDDTSLKSQLWSGYVMEGRAVRIGTDRGQAWPDPEWRDYGIRLASEVAKLGRQSSWEGFNMASDPNDGAHGLPYKITDIIDWLLYQAGYPASMIDVPDLPLRFWKTEEPLILEWRTDLIAKAMELARDYLGMFLVWDPNAGTGDYGMWRLKAYPRPPYTNLVEFLSEIPTPGPLPHVPGAYPTDVSGTQPMLKTFVKRGTLEEYVIPPEGNMVEVMSAIGNGPGMIKGGQLQSVVNRAYNFKSAKFFDSQPIAPDPTSCDYLGFVSPITVPDPTLQSVKAVKFLTRRIYDMACHGAYAKRFDAPLLLVTEVADASQIRPRPLRYGDAVKVDGTQYVVRSVNVHYSAQQGGDRFQWAKYEVETPRPLAETTEADPPS